MRIFSTAVSALMLAGNAMAQPASTEPALSLSKGSVQTYPSKPLRILVGFSPGGASDITTRWSQS